MEREPASHIDDDGKTGSTQMSIVPRVGVPSEAGLGDLIGGDFDAQIGSAAGVDHVQEGSDLWLLDEFAGGKGESFPVLGSVFLRRDGDALGALQVRRVRDPGSSASVQDGIAPGVNVDGETVLEDVGGVGFDSVVVVVVEVDELEGYNDCWRHWIRFLEIDDLLGRLRTGVIPISQLLGVEFAELPVSVGARSFNPCCRTTVENAAVPGIDRYNGVVIGYVVHTRGDILVGFAAHVNARKPNSHLWRTAIC